MQSLFKACCDATCTKAAKCQRISDETLVMCHDTRGPIRDMKTKSCANKNNILAYFGYLFLIAFKQDSYYFCEEDKEIFVSRNLPRCVLSFTLVYLSKDF